MGQRLRGRMDDFVELLGRQLIACGPLDQAMDTESALVGLIGKLS